MPRPPYYNKSGTTFTDYHSFSESDSRDDDEDSDVESLRSHSGQVERSWDSIEALDLDNENFRAGLQECLDNIQHGGSFSSFHTFESYVNPGLDISDYGSVGLPLAVRDAESITRICKQSPFGKGSQTVIDTTVRKTWELDGSQFQCLNPAWTSYLNSLVKQAIEDLGVQVKVYAEQYKLLLYEQGAFFKTHKDSEKVPGMFGTLVICLPSEHCGGDVFLVHGGKEQVLQTAPTSSFSLSMLAWYSDISHQVRPITSGYRLVLTYNLVQSQTTPKQTAAALDESYVRFGQLLATWNRRHASLEVLVYPLMHQYTEASLALRSLKGQDAARGRFLERHCRDFGVCWFLGRLINESVDEDYGDDPDSFSLNHVVSPTGVKMSSGGLDVAEDEILADINVLYDNREPDSEDEGEYTGNEAMTSARRYHDTVECSISLRCPFATNKSAGRDPNVKRGGGTNLVVFRNFVLES
jgi:hypothetical protein